MIQPVGMNQPTVAWIAYCGQYCGACHLYRGEIADLARELLRRLKEAVSPFGSEGMQRVSRRFKSLADYRRFAEALCFLDALRCTTFCRHNPATNRCRVRRCCERKGIVGCWECVKIDACPILARLTPDLRDRQIALLQDIRHHGLAAYFEVQHRVAYMESFPQGLSPQDPTRPVD